jgi:hypothetical protein
MLHKDKEESELGSWKKYVNIDTCMAIWVFNMTFQLYYKGPSGPMS